MTNVPAFISLLSVDGSDAVFHREDGGADCPCLSPEGYRNPQWHKDHPGSPVCNEVGQLPGVVNAFAIKGFVQPAQSAAVRRLTTEYINAMFGEVRTDDHLGIFPLEWSGHTLDFEDWSQAGEDFVMYEGKRYLVVNANKKPDASGGGPHHWEVGLRLIKLERPVVP